MVVGHITWEPMNVDLDKSALSSVNEMNRTELFSAMGMSKTSMGIEESGTTRETARVQNENAATKTYKPRVDFIVGLSDKRLQAEVSTRIQTYWLRYVCRLGY